MGLKKYLKSLKLKHPNLVKQIEGIKTEYPSKVTVEFKLTFRFSKQADCQEFWEKLYHPENQEDVIPIYKEGIKFITGFSGVAPLEEFRIITMYDAWLSICEECNGELEEFCIC